MKKPIITNQLLTQNTIRSRGWTIAQIRQIHTYLIGCPILPGKHGEAIIECPVDQYPTLAELLHVHAANADFKHYGLRISVRVIR